MSEGRTPPETVYANNSNPDVDAISGPTPPFGFPDQGWGAGDRPAITMTHYAAETFCQWLSKQTGKKYRLPTEAEWEYACRAAGQQEMFGGQAPPGGANTAEYADRHGEGTLPVGSFPPNKLGLHDMSGNLWEWVSDIYSPDAYLHHRRDNPHHVADGPARLLRGGGWSHDAGFSRCSKRHMHCRPTARFDFVGFRLVLDSE